MPGDFFTPATEEEIRKSNDPTNPLFFSPTTKRLVQGYLWFFELFFGPAKVAFIYDIFMVIIFTYLGLSYLTPFFIVSISLALPLEYFTFIMYP
jgi:hypothetical protein